MRPIVYTSTCKYKLFRSHILSYSYNDDVINLKTSCNKEDAVAKMIGWLQGPVCSDLTEPEDGFNEQQLRCMDTLVHTLAKHLTDLRKAALLEASAAISFDPKQAESNKVLESVLDIEDISKRANLFLIDIEDELSKGDLSLLIIDKPATEKYGEIQITLKSLDRWAKHTHDISILDYLDSRLIATNIQSSTGIDLTESNSPKKVIMRQRQQEIAIIKVIETFGLNPKSLPKNNKGKSGVKADVRKALHEDPLFSGSTVFDKAWERLSNFKEIVLIAIDPTPK